VGTPSSRVAARENVAAWCRSTAAFDTLAAVKSSVSIVLFFLLSSFFLTVLLGAIEHSRKLLLLAGGCLVAVVCIIVFLTPVQLPSFHLSRDASTTSTTAAPTTSTTAAPTLTTEYSSAPSR
jgi:protein-S-isoprenylcysteine O-methyltransferase Ste14